MANELLNKKYGKGFKEHLLEQYKLYVLTAEAVAKKREAANNFYLSLNSAIFAISGYVSFKGNVVWTLLLSVVGLLIAFVWSRTICSYKQLNTGKYKVIHELEEVLPARLFDYEWTCLGEGRTGKYTKLTTVEGKVPFIFMVLYFTIILLTFLFVFGVIPTSIIS